MSNGKAIEICKRNELWGLIKKVSEYYGGDDKEWLREYSRELLKNNTLDAALACMRDIASMCVTRVIKTNTNNFKTFVNYASVEKC